VSDTTPSDETVTESGDAAERIPVMQHILDNPFLLLFLGVAMPTVIYIVWGVMEMVAIPISPLVK
jgi:hypothetical protein